ncbi:MAG: hypothetical protein IJV40_16085 [Oscillospiraceae bacterium]|nr:hypothetical protein [Oscillospiraceae bacterium]
MNERTKKENIKNVENAPKIKAEKISYKKRLVYEYKLKNDAGNGII